MNRAFSFLYYTAFTPFRQTAVLQQKIVPLGIYQESVKNPLLERFVIQNVSF